MIVLERGRVTLGIDEERGGRLGSCEVDGRELLVGAPDATDRGIRWGSFLMAPWVGRIERGILDWDGSRHQLRLNFGEHAIHGLVFDRAWQVEEASPTRATLACRIGPPDWPARGTVRERFVLAEDHLAAVAEIVADEPMPAALGWHPWFRRGPDDDARLRLEAAEVLETVELIPTGRRAPVDATTDLRGGPSIGSSALDDTYPDAASPAEIRWAAAGLDVEWDRPFSTVVVHSTPTAFCVEPETAWPNAAALAARGVAGTGIATIAAGGSLAATMRWRWA